MGYLVTDGESLFHEEKRDLETRLEYLDDHALGVPVHQRATRGRRYRIVKEVIADPHQPCVLVHTRLEGDEALLEKLRLYVLLAPHLEGGGLGQQRAQGRGVAGKDMLTACRGDDTTWRSGPRSPSPAPRAASSATSDGWTDLKRRSANGLGVRPGASTGTWPLMGELDLSASRTFTLGLAFGFGRHAASTIAAAVAGHPVRRAAREVPAISGIAPAPRARRCRAPPPTADGSITTSRSLLLAHEDKSYPGALIASLSIPWGETRATRTAWAATTSSGRATCATARPALLASATREDSRESAHLSRRRRSCRTAASTRTSGSTASLTGAAVQLDEVGVPGDPGLAASGSTGPCATSIPTRWSCSAAGYLVERSPVTPQERWEENAGYSPSTLAACIAGARLRGAVRPASAGTTATRRRSSRTTRTSSSRTSRPGR